MKAILCAAFFLVVFTTLSAQETFTDKRDGNVYHTITLAGVTWMTENLKFKPVSGALFFDNDSNNVPDYGVLYDWKSATKACPDGWHLPAGTEFQTLSDYFEQNDSWVRSKNNHRSFNIQLAGMQDYEGVFSEIDESGYYWTSTDYDSSNAEYFSYLIINDMAVIDISRKGDMEDIHGSEKINRYSVRCVKN